MRVTVRLFAVLRERAGVSSLGLELAEGATVLTAVEMLAARYPALEQHVACSAFAVNRAYVSRETVLRDGDELAVIPPVSGG